MTFVSLFNFVLIVLGFGLLIFVHELGHFLAAKWAGIRTESFAVGMGPVLLAWRKGVGLAVGSTAKPVVAKYGEEPAEMSDSLLRERGIGETEYSLRILPIGGFVKMVGQDDSDPSAVSEDPRSYNQCPIGKRMIVVSAGVVMNVLMAGVRFEAPVIGEIIPDSPASAATATNAKDQTLQPGDMVLSVDGDETRTFTDLQIAASMAVPGRSLELVVKRPGRDEELMFSITPATVREEGLMELGLTPASSLQLPEGGQTGEEILHYLGGTSVANAGITPGMKMIAAGVGEPLAPVTTWGGFDEVVQASEGKSVQTRWSFDGGEIDATIPVRPLFQILRIPDVSDDAPQNFVEGLFGLVPLSRISHVVPTSPNVGLLHDGDVIVGVDGFEMPSRAKVRNVLAAHGSGEVDIEVLRSGQQIHVPAVLQSGRLGVVLMSDWDLPRIAQPMTTVMIRGPNGLVEQPTALAGTQLLGGSTITSVGDRAVHNWADIRSAVVDAVAGGEEVTDVAISVVNPTVGKERISIILPLEASEAAELADLGWSTPLAALLFEPVYVTRSSNGNPLTAISMGIDETINITWLTYLTIDRLLRRSVGVEQLRGPIGIVHIGARIADRGWSYLFFFLAIISINLAVLNFLPLPIVDGGLFLYLIYEKLRGRPPSIAFQNAAAVLGLALIGMAFVVTFYNDIMRLVG
jgi:regulator of sigma E protease